MSRKKAPASLKLRKSNGTTAAVPSSPPAPPAPAKDQYSASEEKFDERPPPPPPKKSERRKSQRQESSSMGNRTSKEETRRDSKDPEDDQAQAQRSQAVQAVNRKPLPPPSSTKKFPGLADLQQGPRGRSTAPKHTTASSVDSASTVPQPQQDVRRPSPPRKEESRRPSPHRKDAVQRKPTPPRPSEEEAPRNALSGIRPTFSAESQLPPTPDEQPAAPPKDSSLPLPPRKVFAGLPSNPSPRMKGPDPPTPTSVKHTRGKSSTGFDLMKVNIPFPSKAYLKHSPQREWCD